MEPVAAIDSETPLAPGEHKYKFDVKVLWVEYL